MCEAEANQALKNYVGENQLQTPHTAFHIISLQHTKHTHSNSHSHTNTSTLSLSQFLTPSLIHYIPLSFFSETFYFLFSRHFPIFVNHLVQQTQVKVCQCFSTFLNLKSFWLQDVVKGFDPPSLSGILAVSYMKLIFNIYYNKQWYHCRGWQMKGSLWMNIFLVFFSETTWWSIFYMVVHDLMCDKYF